MSDDHTAQDRHAGQVLLRLVTELGDHWRETAERDHRSLDQDEVEDWLTARAYDLGATSRWHP